MENTIIIFTSDNGVSPASKLDELEAKGHFSSSIYRGHKADIFEGGHRVPFIVSWPSIVDSGSTSSDLVCTTDLMATIAQILGYKLSQTSGEDSYSFLNSLKGEKSVRNSIVHHSINGSFAFRKGDWKLILCPGSGGWSSPKPNDTLAVQNLPPFQLYNLVDDPIESKNLYTTHPEKVVEMKSELLSIINSGRSTNGPPLKNDPGFKGWPQLDKILNE